MLVCDCNRITDEAWELKEQLYERGLLQRFDPVAVSSNGQVLFSLCGDGTHFLDKAYHLEQQLARVGMPEPHQIGATHGGAIHHARIETFRLFVRDEMEHIRARRKFKEIWDQFVEAHDMGKGNVFLDYVHTFCKKANGELRLSPLEQLYLAADVPLHFEIVGIDRKMVQIPVHFSRELKSGEWQRETWLLNCDRFRREAPPIRSLTHRPGCGLTPTELWTVA